MRPSGCQPSRLVWSGQTVRYNVSEASSGLDQHLRGFSRYLMFQQVGCHQVLVPLGFLGAAQRLGTSGSRGLIPRRRRFGGSRPTEHRALYRMVRQLHLAGERSTGPTPRQLQLGVADSHVLPIATFSRFSIRGFPVSTRSLLFCGLGSATMLHGSTSMLAKCWVRSW